MNEHDEMAALEEGKQQQQRQQPSEPSSDSFGTNMERAKLIHNAGPVDEQIKKWAMLSLSLVLSLVVVNAMVYGFLVLVVADDNTTTALTKEPGDAASPYLLAVSETHPNSLMSSSQFQVYLGFCLWITVVITGLGLEIIAFLLFLPSKWSHKLQSYWILAQSLFSILAMTAVGMAMSHNFAAVLVFVPGMWKLGFPQTILYMYLALNDESLSVLKRIGYCLNAMGLITHHAAGALAVSMAVTGVIDTISTGGGRAVLDIVLIAMIQHWFFFLRYVHKNLYAATEIILEFWFEWITLSNLEVLYDNHWTIALFGGTFLVGHWFFLGAAAIEHFTPPVLTGLSTSTIETQNLQRCPLEEDCGSSLREDYGSPLCTPEEPVDC